MFDAWFCILSPAWASRPAALRQGPVGPGELPGNPGWDCCEEVQIGRRPHAQRAHCRPAWRAWNSGRYTRAGIPLLALAVGLPDRQSSGYCRAPRIPRPDECPRGRPDPGESQLVRRRRLRQFPGRAEVSLLGRTEGPPVGDAHGRPLSHQYGPSWSQDRHSDPADRIEQTRRGHRARRRDNTGRPDGRARGAGAAARVVLPMLCFRPPATRFERLAQSSSEAQNKTPFSLLLPSH